MSVDAVSSPASAILNPFARFTRALFGLVPASLALLVLRLTLAMPFFKSGLTRWDGWFTLSFGAKTLFATAIEARDHRRCPRRVAPSPSPRPDRDASRTD